MCVCVVCQCILLNRYKSEERRIRKEYEKEGDFKQCFNIAIVVTNIDFTHSVDWGPSSMSMDWVPLLCLWTGSL